MTPTTRATPLTPLTPLAVILVLALAACGAPAPPDTTPAPFTISGQVYEDTTWTPVAIGLYVFDGVSGGVISTVPGAAPDLVRVDTAAAGPTFAFVEDLGYLSTLAPVDADARFALALPAGNAVPESVMFPAASFWRTIADQATCQVSASDDDAMVSGVYVVGPYVVLPSLYGVYVRADAVLGGPLLSFDGALDFDTKIDERDLTFVTWAYADRAVDVTTNTCSVEGVVVELDVSLAAGWNQLGYTFEANGAVTSARLVSVPPGEVTTVLD